jgi:3-dehydroquinate synthase
MDCLDCNFGSKIYIGSEIDIEAKKLAIITDSNVIKLHSERLTEKLGSLEHTFFPFTAGESSKTRKTKERLEDLLISHGFGKECAIVGFGGGVVTDLAGFIAATYMRGVPYYAIPTTLMGMIDAAIGGKTSVNTPAAKNAIGCIYPARSIYIDPTYLDTLPEQEMLCGFAEVYKYAFIAEPGLLKIKNMKELITMSCHVKKLVVEKDLFDSGFRRILNFGHTIGHALEAASNFQIPHGFAVALGMRAESWMSYALGHLPKEDLDLIDTTLKIYPKSPSLSRKRILDALSHDKKPGFVLLKRIGVPMEFGGNYCAPVANELIEEAISRIC